MMQRRAVYVSDVLKDLVRGLPEEVASNIKLG